MAEVISQNEYVCRYGSGRIYRGLVKGIGEVDSICKGVVIIPPGTRGNKYAYSEIVNGQTLDKSPEKVLKSWGSDLPNMIKQRIVTEGYDKLYVYVGNNNEIILNKELNPKVDCELVDGGSAVKITIQYTTNKNGFGKTIIKNSNYNEGEYSVTYQMKDVYSSFIGSRVEDLCTPQPESNYMCDIISDHVDITPQIKRPESSSNFPYYLGGLSLSTSAIEAASVWNFNSKVIMHTEIDRLTCKLMNQVELESQILKNATNTQNYRYGRNGKMYFNESKEQILNRQINQYKQATKLANERSAAKAAESYKNLSNGLDVRTARNYKVNARLGVLNKALSGVGVAISIANLYDYASTYGNYEGENCYFWHNPTSWRLTADLAFSAVAFVPGWGWVASGLYFIGTTLYDVATSEPTEPIEPTETYHPHPVNPWQNEMETGMRRDKTRVNINREVIEMRLREIERDQKDRSIPMKIGGIPMGCSVYEWKRLQEKIYRRRY